MDRNNAKQKIPKVGVIIYGCSGAGKKSAGGTVDKLCGSQTIETGEFCRKMFAAKAHGGILVNDKIIVNHIREQIIAQGYPLVFCLDGAPRTIEQGKMILELFRSLGYSIIISFFINTPKKICFDRIRKRALEEKRLDDAKVRTILKRIGNFQEQVPFIIPFLQEHTLFYEIDGMIQKDQRSNLITTILQQNLTEEYFIVEDAVEEAVA